jgi:hypothetical protein
MKGGSVEVQKSKTWRMSSFPIFLILSFLTNNKLENCIDKSILFICETVFKNTMLMQIAILPIVTPTTNEHDHEPTKARFYPENTPTTHG